MDLFVIVFVECFQMSLKSSFLIQVLLYNDNPFVLKIQPFSGDFFSSPFILFFHYIPPNAVFFNLFFLNSCML